MRRALAAATIASLAAMTAASCGLDTVGTGAPAIPDEAGSPIVVPEAGGEAASDAQVLEASPCTGVMCGSQCVADCTACAGALYECGGTCVADCKTCNGGTDFVVCLTCPGGGPMKRKCGPVGGGGCLGGQYDHCPCTKDSDCPSQNQRCSFFGGRTICAACGEPVFNVQHDGCNSGAQACCCKSGARAGQCACGC
jgi:hypothetical protein